MESNLNWSPTLQLWAFFGVQRFSFGIGVQRFSFGIGVQRFSFVFLNN
ncbi:MAG: hypothetical protein KAI83_14215 [Thiomargarita sp.]|nr:hypothetical protein [Thiomargarita sp.]